MAEAIPRLNQPEMPMAEGMFARALLGVSVNGYAVYKLHHGKTLNEKVLTWHLLEDVLGWIAVLVVSVVLMFVEIPILNPLLSIGFTLFILFNVLGSVRQTLSLFLQGVPDEKMQQQIVEDLVALPRVTDTHHVHFWSLDGEQHVLTAHLVFSMELNTQQVSGLKRQIAEQLSQYPLAHTTIEFEFPDEQCRDKHRHIEKMA